MKLSQVISEVLDAAEESGVMFLYVDLELLSLKSGHKRSRLGLALSAAIKHTKWVSSQPQKTHKAIEGIMNETVSDDP